MLPRRQVAPSSPEATDLRGTTSAVCCKRRSLMRFHERGRETLRCARLRTQGSGGRDCLVARNKDFIPAISGPRGAAGKKKLEFRGNPGYPSLHIIQTDELGPRAWDCCGLPSVSPVQSYGLPVLPTQDGTTPE
jgi:hypothetical protein